MLELFREIEAQAFGVRRDLDAGDVVTFAARRTRLVQLLEQLDPRRPMDQTKPDSQPEHIAQFFAYEHLPPVLQEVSRPFGELASTILATLPRNPERTVALRKLLEAKDAAVRAKLAK